MSISKKILQPLAEPTSFLTAVDDVEDIAKQIERFMFRICSNLSLAQKCAPNEKDHYIQKACQACKELNLWSER